MYVLLLPGHNLSPYIIVTSILPLPIFSHHPLVPVKIFMPFILYSFYNSVSLPSIFKTTFSFIVSFFFFIPINSFLFHHHGLLHHYHYHYLPPLPLSTSSFLPFRPRLYSFHPFILLSDGGVCYRLLPLLYQERSILLGLYQADGPYTTKRG